MAEPKKNDRSWLYVGITFAMFWAAYLIFFNPRIGPDGLGVPALGPPLLPLPADYAWKLTDLDGKPVSFDEFRGKPVVLNIWATWCGPCRMEMPSLETLAAKPELKGVAFLGVTREEPAESIKKYANESMKGIRVLYAESVPAVFTTDGIPATFIIDPNGKVVAADVGASKWDDPTVVAFLSKLAKP